MPDGDNDQKKEKDAVLDELYKRLAREMPYAGEVEYPVTSMDDPLPKAEDPTGTEADYDCMNRFGPLRDYGQAGEDGPKGKQIHTNLFVLFSGTGQS